MKLFIGLSVVVVMVLLAFMEGSSSARRRARFIRTMNALKEAHVDLQQLGGFTNYFREMNIYLFTNRFIIGATDYQCEFAVETDEFRDRGFLTITTNAVFVWVDKKRGLIPLLKPETYPPGL